MQGWNNTQKLKWKNDLQITGPMVKGIAAIGSSFIAVGIHTGEVKDSGFFISCFLLSWQKDLSSLWT